MRRHDYIPTMVKILKREPQTNDVVALRLKKPKNLHFHPGQFVMLSVLGYGEIPIGLTNANNDNFLEVAIRSVGGVSQKICALEVGDEIGLSGPFGNGFPMSELKGKEVLLIAGGLGLAPLRSLIKTVEANSSLVKSLIIMNGAKTPNDLVYQKEYPDWEKFSKLLLTVDKCGPGWKECVGLITKLFEKTEVKPGTIIITCGPSVMFDSIIKRYAGKRVNDKDLYFLLERRMKCGIGKCQHCTCGKYYVCLDGPVFSYQQIKYNDEAFK